MKQKVKNKLLEIRNSCDNMIQVIRSKRVTAESAALMIRGLKAELLDLWQMIEGIKEVSADHMVLKNHLRQARKNAISSQTMFDLLARSYGTACTQQRSDGKKIKAMRKELHRIYRILDKFLVYGATLGNVHTDTFEMDLTRDTMERIDNLLETPRLPAPTDIYQGCSNFSKDPLNTSNSTACSGRNCILASKCALYSNWNRMPKHHDCETGSLRKSLIAEVTSNTDKSLVLVVDEK